MEESPNCDFHGKMEEPQQNVNEMLIDPIHNALEPLKFLIGKWKSIKATVINKNSTIEYSDLIEFSSFGQPLLNYSSTTWNASTKKPMHLESGFLRIKPGTLDVAFMVAHNFGVTSIEEGVINGNEIVIRSKHINRMSFAKDPGVTDIKRVIKFNDLKELEITMYLGTTDNPDLVKHLVCVYEKISANLDY